MGCGELGGVSDMDLIELAENSLNSGSHETPICQIARNRLPVTPVQGVPFRERAAGVKASDSSQPGAARGRNGKKPRNRTPFPDKLQITRY